MITNAKVVARSLMALAVGLIVVSQCRAATPDRTHLFGDDMSENPVVGGTPNSDFGALTLDTTYFSTAAVPTDATDLSFSGGPTYFNTGSGPLARPGAATGTFGLQFNGTSDNLFRDDRGLGVPAQADDNYGSGTSN